MRFLLFLFPILFTQFSSASELASILQKERVLREAANTLEPVRLSDEQIADLLNQLDELSLDKIDFLAKDLMGEVERIYKKRLDNSANMPERYLEIKSAYNRYLSYRSLFGLPKDYLRTEAFRDFIQLSLAFVNSGWAKKKTSPKQWFSSVPGFFHTLLSAPRALRFLSPSFRRSFEGLSIALDIVDSSSPIVFRSGIQYIGLENLERLETKGAKTIVVINHSLPALDGFVWSYLMGRLPGRPGIIGMAQGWKNDIMAKLVIENEGIVIVGERDGIKFSQTSDRVVEALDRGVDHLFIFPEGSSGAGIGEIKPLAPGFVKRLIPQIKEKYQVELLTVTTIDTYAKLGHWNSDLPAEVIVSEPIKDGEVSSYLRHNPEGIENRIRGEWINQLAQRSDRIFGQYQILDLLQSVYGPDILCQKIFN